MVGLSVVRELPEPDEHQAKTRFQIAVERVMHAEIRYGWLQAINRQSVRGAVNRCFEYIDDPVREPQLHVTA